MSQLPRGVRNNNPGNIEKGIRWDGLADEQPDSRFCTFISPEWGARAMCKILYTYRHVHNRWTVERIIERWAPPHENDVNAYVNFVLEKMGWRDPGMEVKYLDYAKFAHAMHVMENGDNFFPLKVFDDGFALAFPDKAPPKLPEEEPHTGQTSEYHIGYMAGQSDGRAEGWAAAIKHLQEGAP